METTSSSTTKSEQQPYRPPTKPCPQCGGTLTLGWLGNNRAICYAHRNVRTLEQFGETTATQDTCGYSEIRWQS